MSRDVRDDFDAVKHFCRLTCTGRLEEAAAVLAQDSHLTRASILCAAAWGDVESVAMHMEEDGARVQSDLGNGLSPLMLAALSHRARPDSPASDDVVECARLLIEHGADVDGGVEDTELPGHRLTALAAAAGVTGNRALTTLLLVNGASPNDGATLFIAAAEEHWGCVAEVVRHGGDLDATDADERYAPLHWLLDLRYRRAALERLLAEGADVDRRAGQLDETPLHVAVRRRRLDAVDVLLDAGADPNALTTGGMTPYRHALRRDFTEVATRLAERGADTTTTPGDALARALHEKDLERARALLAETPNLVPSNVPEEARLLPDLAARGARRAVELLLDHGVDLDVRGLDDGTALHQAAWFGQPEVARLLIERGAPLAVRDDYHDCTPLGWVAHGSRVSDGADERVQAYVRIAEDLLRAGAPFPQPHEHHDRFQFAMAADAVVAVLRRFGWTG